MNAYSASTSVNQHTAIDVQRDTGAVGRQIAGQKQTSARHILGTTQTRQRDACNDVGLSGVIEFALGDVGFNQSVAASPESQTATCTASRASSHPECGRNPRR